jgi:anti-anti-sigma factor
MTDTLLLPNKPLSSAKRHDARFDTRWTTSLTAIVHVNGDIDGSNAATFTDHAFVNAVRSRGLILDLTDLEFFGTEGFLALHRVSVRCAHAEIRWVVVPGTAVSRMLRICDPHGSLPTVDTVDAALAKFQDHHTAA